MIKTKKIFTSPYQTIEERPKPVLTKNDFVVRYARGEFGNASPTWNNYAECAADRQLRGKYSRTLFHIRNRVAGAATWYNIAGANLRAFWQDVLDVGYSASQLYISEMAPTALTTFQGEVAQTVRGLDLTYTRVAKPMRAAFADSLSTAHGLQAWALLGHNLCSNSYGWLVELFKLYPEHVIEFSCYREPWGTLPHYNTVFWEVRKY